MDPDPAGLDGTILLRLRAPRVAVAALAGGGLAAAGAALQALLRNPLAEPYVLGVSGGAALGATAALLAGLGGVAWFGAGLVPLALGNAGSTLVAQRIGAGDLPDARRLGWHGLQFSVVVAATMGVLVFVGLTAWDTQKIKESYDVGFGHEVLAKGAIMGALSLYLDFINLFQFLLRFMGDRR